MRRNWVEEYLELKKKETLAEIEEGVGGFIREAEQRAEGKRSRRRKKTMGQGALGYPPSLTTLAKYGLKQEDYDRMTIRQGGACAICGDDGSSLLIDHDHLTGEVRGLLCMDCNFMLGNAHDDIRILHRGIMYLKK